MVEEARIREWGLLHHQLLQLEQLESDGRHGLEDLRRSLGIGVGWTLVRRPGRPEPASGLRKRVKGQRSGGELVCVCVRERERVGWGGSSAPHFLEGPLDVTDLAEDDVAC